MSAIEWLATILGVAKEAAGIIQEFQRDGRTEPTVDELMQALTERHGADANFQQALDRLRR